MSSLDQVTEKIEVLYQAFADLYASSPKEEKAKVFNAIPKKNKRMENYVLWSGTEKNIPQIRLDLQRVGLISDTDDYTGLAREIMDTLVPLLELVQKTRRDIRTMANSN